MVGVNVASHEPSELKAVMTKEKLNWRSFADQGAIVRKWNFPSTPTFYIIDPTGVIRHKWVGHPGERTIDAALEKLLREAEETEAQK